MLEARRASDSCSAAQYPSMVSISTAATTPIEPPCYDAPDGDSETDLTPFFPKTTAGSGKIPEGIDCQRCHGPGQAHIEALRDRKNVSAVQAAIVNPARLAQGAPIRRWENVRR